MRPPDEKKARPGKPASLRKTDPDGNGKANNTPRQQFAQPYTVSTQKTSGKFIVFGRYNDQGEARRVAKLLAWAGAVARLSGPNGELVLDAQS